MSRHLFAPGIAVLALAFGACAPGPTFDVVIDGKAESFNDGVTTKGTTDGTAFRIRITGSNDPIKTAIDDESSMSLELNLDRAGMEALPRNQALRIKGINSFPPVDENGWFAEPHAPTFSPGEGHASAITGVSLVRSCFCALNPNTQITQDFEGTLLLRDLSNGLLEVELDLTMQGQIPYASSTTAGTRTELNATVQVQAP